MAANEKNAIVARRQEPSRVQIVHQGHCGMVSKDRAANDRFRRNCEAKPLGHPLRGGLKLLVAASDRVEEP